MDALGSSDSIFKGSKRLEEENILAMEILGLEEALVPTELPEGPVDSSPRDGTLHEADTKAFGGVDLFSLPLPRPERLNTELNPASLHQAPAHSTSPLSASSNCSISSESSVLIIGDAFLAPTKLKSYLERNPNVTNSADYDSFWQNYSCSSISGSIVSPSIGRQLPRLDSVSSPPASPARRLDITRPVPTPPVQPQTNEPHSPVTRTTNSSGKSSPVFQRFPIGTPKPNVGGTKTSHSEPYLQPQTKYPRNRGNHNKRGQSSQGQNLGIAHPDHTTSRSTVQQDPRRKSATPNLSSKLNPFAPSFKPEASPKPRAISLPYIQQPAQRVQVDDGEKTTPSFIYDSSTSIGNLNHPNNRLYATSTAVNQQGFPSGYGPRWTNDYLQNAPPRFMPAYATFDGQTMIHPYFEAQPIRQPNPPGVAHRHMQAPQAYFPLETPRDDFSAFQIMQNTPVFGPEQRQTGYYPAVHSMQIPGSLPISPLSHIPGDVAGIGMAGYFNLNALRNQSPVNPVTPGQFSYNLTPFELPDSDVALYYPTIQVHDHGIGSFNPYHQQQTPEKNDNRTDHMIGPRLRLPPRRTSGRQNKSGQEKGRPEGSPKSPGTKLADRGKSVLTPVTERSETSSVNISLLIESPLHQEISRLRIDGETSIEPQLAGQKDLVKKKVKRRNKRKGGLVMVNGVLRPAIEMKEAEEKGKQKG
ncbi:hypothetical protein CPB86DRAFT_782672 [Serendipita vermifera]|nr:hypothetical protein CPB86DRAFT_782672 [Serendipita vermifera]